MKAALTLMLTLLQVSHGVEASCDGRQDGAQCFGALGGSVDIRLMDSASDLIRYDLKKETTVILRGRQDRIVSNLIKSRSLFTPSNGTFKINELSRTDGGEYTLEITDQTGTNPTRRTLLLTIQAPVSSVQLVFKCLSQGEMRVSCSSEGGDSPQYSWTLDGNTLMDTQLLSGSKDHQIIILKQKLSGRLICVVRNQISQKTKETKISSCGVEASCDGRQDGAQCYGALGGSVNIRLMDSASEIFRYDWKKETTVILRGRQNKIVSNLMQSRSSFTLSNGIFRINELKRDDGGEYTLETNDRTGAKSTRRTLQLSVQAPVSSVQLVSKCLSQGEVGVSCSSEGGDSPQYSWTLDGNTLMDTQLLSGSKDHQIIILKQKLSGRLICVVRNQISRKTKETKISSCGFEFFDCTLINGTSIKQWLIPTNDTQCIEPTTTTAHDPSLLVCGVRAAVVTLILIGIAVYFVWKKKKIEEAEDSVEYENTSVMMVEVRASASEL